MLTFKKLALVGAAGLAAFSMSCSDTGDESGGTMSGLTITDGTEGIDLGGIITANEGLKVKAVKAEIAGKNPVVDGITGLPKSPVDLSGAYLTKVCGTDTGTKTYDIKIIVTFSDDTSISETKKGVSVNCGSTPPITTGVYTLSFAGESYLDVDGETTYKQSALTAAIKELIDLVAYASASAENKIYNACYISTIGADDCGVPELYNSKVDLDNEENEITEINISNNKVFYLNSTEADTFKVTITGTAANSVTLKVESL